MAQDLRCGSAALDEFVGGYSVLGINTQYQGLFLSSIDLVYCLFSYTGFPVISKSTLNISTLSGMYVCMPSVNPTEKISIRTRLA